VELQVVVSLWKVQHQLNMKLESMMLDSQLEDYVDDSNKRKIHD
jgi:hypothetical protein